MKNTERLKIPESYNVQGDIISVPRTDVQLKNLWNNLKRKRKETTEFKYSRLKTGGGSPLEENPNPVMEAVSVAARHMDVSVLCPWDSTAQLEKCESISPSNRDTTVEHQFSYGATTADHSPLYYLAVLRNRCGNIA